jgi:hypothetical protein
MDIAERAYAAIDPESIAPSPARLAALLTLNDLAEELLERPHTELQRGHGEDALDAEADQLIATGKLKNNRDKWFIGEEDGSPVYGRLDQEDRNAKVKSFLMDLEFWAGYSDVEDIRAAIQRELAVLIANEIKLNLSDLPMQSYNVNTVFCWLRKHDSWISSKEFTELLFTRYNVVYGALKHIITVRLEAKCVGPNSEAIAFEGGQGVVYKLRSLATDADTEAATQLASKRQKQERAAQIRQRGRLYMSRADALDRETGQVIEDYPF